jgi:hypothetical protein
MLDFATGALLWCGFTGLLFATLWLWYERRDRARLDQLRQRATFYCVQCASLYAAPRTESETASCPKCGQANFRLKF